MTPPVIINVDDYQPGRYMRSRLLRSAGFEVHEAGSGEEALAIVRRIQPQLVVLDVNLPDISGLEVCRRIKADPATANIAVLHVSATSVGTEAKVEGLRGGSDGYLVEPVEPDELLATIDALLRLKRTEQALRESNATLNALVESSPLAVVVTDMDGRVVRWNPAAERIFGWTAEEALGRPLPFVPPHRRDELRSNLAHVLAGRAIIGREAERVRRDGSPITISISTAPLRDQHGTVVGVVGLAEDITERKRTAQELARLYDEVSRAARAKDEFLATLSHELRTPLNAMLGWVRLLRRGQVPEDRVPYALEVVERNTLAQLRLIEDILDVSRIVSGKLRLHLERLDLLQVVSAAVEAQRPSAEARALALEIDLPDEQLCVEGDFERLLQVVSNLIANAVKFTPHGGRVSIALERRGADAVLRVADTGIGIDPEFLPHVFERFRQADSAASRRHGGLGLGLAITRHIVEAHGGTIAAHSPGPDRGSTFEVTVPLQEQRDLLPSIDRGGQAMPSDLTGTRVLVVDDEADARDLLRQVLSLEGAAVRTASSVTEAEHLIGTFRPQALVADIGMPDEDGYALMRRLRDAPATRQLFAVAVSGYASEDDRVQARLAGFDEHLSKPVDAERLVALIARGAGVGRPA